MRSKIYFASDFHLGTSGAVDSKTREKQIIAWLNSIESDMSELYLVGDVFDYWYEYKNVVPKGNIRLFGKLAALSDNGVKIHLFTGNHDLWIKDYLKDEIGLEIYYEAIEREINGLKFLIGHGDGLGPGDHGYKLIKKIFSNGLCQWLFSRLHPNFAIALMKYFSKSSRDKYPGATKFLGADKEWLVQYSEEIISKRDIDFFIFGHRHLAMNYLLSNQSSRYINLGEWLYEKSYAVLDGKHLSLKFYDNPSETYYTNQAAKIIEHNT
jgi:UDP-2,3-diacylglucosamine hydrolase